MSFLKRLFGGEAKQAPDTSVDYKGYTIQPAPEAVGGNHRIGALISKTDGEVRREHHLIRADMVNSRDTAVELSVNKAKQMIDEQGDGIFQ